MFSKRANARRVIMSVILSIVCCGPGSVLFPWNVLQKAKGCQLLLFGGKWWHVRSCNNLPFTPAT